MLLVAFGILLTGCANNPRGFQTLATSEKTGEGACSAFTAPKYRVLGKTQYDQDWVDDQTETLVAGCNFPRPAARPPELDPPANVAVVPGVPAPELQAPAIPAKKPSYWQRVKKATKDKIKKLKGKSNAPVADAGCYKDLPVYVCNGGSDTNHPKCCPEA